MTIQKVKNKLLGGVGLSIAAVILGSSLMASPATAADAPVVGAPKLEATLVGAPEVITADGQLVKWTATITNVGGDDFGTNKVGARFEYVGGEWNGLIPDEASFNSPSGVGAAAGFVSDGTTRTWYGAIASGETKTFSYTSKYDKSIESGDTYEQFTPLIVDADNNDVVMNESVFAGVKIFAETVVTKTFKPSGKAAPSPYGTYTLTFTNNGLLAANADYTDDLTDVLDDATLVGDPVGDNDDFWSEKLGNNVLILHTTNNPGQTTTVTYDVILNPSDAPAGDGILKNCLSEYSAPMRMAPKFALLAADEDGEICSTYKIPTDVTPVVPVLEPAATCGVEATVSAKDSDEVAYTQTGTGNVITVTAVAKDGFAFAPGEVTSWDFTIPAIVPCPGKPVTPVVPTLVLADKCGVEDSITIPTVEGITYTQDRVGTKVAVVATANEGFAIAEGAEDHWVFGLREVVKCDEVVVPPTTEPTVKPTPEPTVPPTVKPDVKVDPVVETTKTNALAETGASQSVLWLGIGGLFVVGAGIALMTITRRKARAAK